MLVYKCDRCGKTFSDTDILHKIYKMHGLARKFNKMEINGWLKKYCLTVQELDLCENCAISLTQWLNEGKSNEI